MKKVKQCYKWHSKNGYRRTVVHIIYHQNMSIFVVIFILFFIIWVYIGPLLFYKPNRTNQSQKFLIIIK